MDRVASAASVSKQTLYSYFKDKEGLFTALVERVVSEKIQMLFGSQPLQGEPSVVLRRVAVNALKQIASDRQYLSLLRLVFAESEQFPNLGQVFLCNGFGRSIKTLTEYFSSHSELEISDPEATARIFVGTLMSYLLTMEMLHGKQIMPMESDRLIDNLVNLVIPGG
jgi:TetR/AcrR family transcriptional regulator, regulator of autoinduction and epiphytic fitness